MPPDEVWNVEKVETLSVTLTVAADTPATPQANPTQAHATVRRITGKTVLRGFMI
ncbi:MAG TPA: hypothetical protein VIM44_01840 [Rariglobus sp.]